MLKDKLVASLDAGLNGMEFERRDTVNTTIKKVVQQLDDVFVKEAKVLSSFLFLFILPPFYHSRFPFPLPYASLFPSPPLPSSSLSAIHHPPSRASTPLLSSSPRMPTPSLPPPASYTRTHAGA